MKKIYIFFYILFYSILILIISIGILYYLYNIRNNPFLDLSYKINRILNSNIKKCKIINTKKYKYINLYKNVPNYINLCAPMNYEVTKSANKTNILYQNYMDPFGYIYLSNIEKNQEDNYNINSIYHELIHYNFLIFNLKNPFNNIDKIKAKIYLKAKKICDKNNIFNEKYNFDEFYFKKLVCKNYNWIKKFYKFKVGKEYKFGEEIIAYQTRYLVPRKKYIKYPFNAKKIKDKDLRELFNYINIVNAKYIFKKIK